METDPIICELCEREVERTSRHHLIPRTLHSNKWFKKRFSREQMEETVDLCRDCHRQIHRFINHKELGRHYNSLEKLLSHEKVKNFVAWLTR
ncbi:MAG: hypothetical protein AAF399_11720 [Bacteroidota bacterium]